MWLFWLNYFLPGTLLGACYWYKALQGLTDCCIYKLATDTVCEKKDINIWYALLQLPSDITKTSLTESPIWAGFLLPNSGKPLYRAFEVRSDNSISSLLEDSVLIHGMFILWDLQKSIHVLPQHLECYLNNCNPCGGSDVAAFQGKSILEEKSECSHVWWWWK